MSVLEITDKNGWRRDYPLQTAIVHIGSAPTNEIVLEQSRGTGVAHRHAQIINAGDGGFRLINLGDSEITLVSEGNRPLAPLASAQIAPGASLKIGEFSLMLKRNGGGSAGPVGGAVSQTATNGGSVSAAMNILGDATAMMGASPGGSSAADFYGSERTSDKIGLSVNLPHTQLAPDRPIEGAIKIKNQGNRPGVQFKVEIENLDSDYYEIGPAPILFPNVEKDIVFKLQHAQKTEIPAGEHRFLVRASAPEAYPGEVTAVAQVINVAPIYKHEMSLFVIDDEEAEIDD